MKFIITLFYLLMIVSCNDKNISLEGSWYPSLSQEYSLTSYMELKITADSIYFFEDHDIIYGEPLLPHLDRIKLKKKNLIYTFDDDSFYYFNKQNHLALDPQGFDVDYSLRFLYYYYVNDYKRYMEERSPSGQNINFGEDIEIPKNGN